MSSSTKVGKLFLNKELSLQDLNKGIEFEVEYDDHDSELEEDAYFDKDAFKTFKDDVSKLDNEFKPKLLSGDNVSFAVFKERMTSITNDKKVLKEVLQPGTGVVLPNMSVVMVHYDAYLENKTEPFDSTRLRKRPYKFLLGEGNLVPGLELGIRTMKKDELSRFLIGPEYAYGAMGCPPRIPPAAEILYEVEIINFYESKEAIEYDDMTPENQKKAPFEKVVSVYHCEHKMANDLFQSKCYKQAIARYRKATKMLDEVSVANEEEDEKRNSYLLKLYLNLAQCFINIQEPQKGVIYSDLALKIDPENPKALYRMGISLHLLDEYGRAEYYLNKAKKHKPYEKSINAAIAKLEFKRKQHLDWEKMFCRKAFHSESDLEKTDNWSESPEFVKAIEEQLEAFLNTKENELLFSAGYTENQLEVVKGLAKNYNLAFVSKIMCGNKINKVVKRV